MKSSIWIITKKELNSFFDSLTAYILLVAFLGFSGFFTWITGSDIFMRKEADLEIFFSVSKWTLFFFIPAITMKMIAEENKSGTIELLLTKAITPRQIVLGKFFACLLLIVIALLFTMSYYVTVSQIGNIDHGATICGYLGLILMSAAYIGIGLFASSITNNQIVAFLLALLIGVFFHFIFDMMSYGASGLFGQILSVLSVNRHFDSLAQGVLDTKDLLFFISLTLAGLYLSELYISKRAK
ncbi:MAG: ABC transporter permease subunit [Saprospiraceae bacterium]|nr:ABC transporter permease subunit [Saprospiraceae bacterium]MBK8449214.1 ABC transporter permease subunit [Saprospiraceae bacterium]MBK9222136.1 ABC transporter permease subunit [Saprospiraceae bacterium]MBK9720954.1 ABC transporter permease subunit [Saprospiraceae bacterium]MBK9727948.1 ABC transporter permease subunit [Saprospiraceae bacterium]